MTSWATRQRLTLQEAAGGTGHSADVVRTRVSRAAWSPRMILTVEHTFEREPTSRTLNPDQTVSSPRF